MYPKHISSKRRINCWIRVTTLLHFGNNRSSGVITMHSSKKFLSHLTLDPLITQLKKRHVNNVHYLRFFESGRLKWLTSFAHALGGPTKARDMISARGVGLILKWIDVRYRRPVRFPDTVCLPPPPPMLPTATSFHVIASYSTQALSRLPQHLRRSLRALTYRIQRSCSSLLFRSTRYSRRLQFHSRLVRL